MCPDSSLPTLPNTKPNPDVFCCLTAVTPTTPTTPATGSSGYQKPYSYLPNGNYLTTVNDQIIDQNGNTVKLHGIAWFGFGEASSAMVEGLTSGSDSQTLDFSTVVRRMKVMLFCGNVVTLLKW